MLVFAGMDGDEAAERAAKLKALQDHFEESSPQGLQMLTRRSLSKENQTRGTQLVITSRADADTFAGMNANTLYYELVKSGFESGAFQSMYLIAFEFGQPSRKGAIVSNFAHDLNSIFKQNHIDIALYAPRGTVTYAVQMVVENGVSDYRVEGISIRAPERDYTLSKGMLRVII